MSAVYYAPAKVNLTLEVLGRRPDGYHELASVFATIDLRDQVRVSRARALDVRIRPGVGVPRNQDLCARAARTLAEAVGREPDVRIDVRKRIPVAAGLGGGSSDAGAVLRALRDLWKVNADVVALGAAVGSDVPFFSAGARLALVRGRGERLEPLAPPPREVWLTLAAPAGRLATAAVFAARHDDERSDGAASEALAAALRRPDARAAELRALVRNDLTAAAERVWPPIAEMRARAAASGVVLHLSGSGPSQFALADDRADAIRIARALRRLGYRARPHRLAVEYG